MEGRNGQHYDESPEPDSSIKKIAAAFGIDNVTINKVKQSLPSTNIFRVVSDPSALTITKVPSGGTSSTCDNPDALMARNLSDSTSVTITKVPHFIKTDSNDPISASIKDLSRGSFFNNDLSSDASKMDDDSYDSGSFYPINGDHTNVDSANNDEIRAYECEDCGRGFKRADHLKKHKTTHTGLKPYECDQCDKKYTQSSSLKIHKMSHSNSNSRKFHCDLCPRTFTQPASLTLHRRSHLSIAKMFECPTCGKGYNNTTNLALHQRTHSENFKFFTCDICGKKFTQKGNLNTHKMIHDNIRPYKCSVCGKEFVQKNNYLLHMKTHEKNSTSGHMISSSPLKKPPVQLQLVASDLPMASDAAESSSENDEEDDAYLDDFVVGTLPAASETSIFKTVSSTPEKINKPSDESPKEKKDIVSAEKSKTQSGFTDITSSVPFVCIDCNNKPFSDKCRLNNHKMYVLF